MFYMRYSSSSEAVQQFRGKQATKNRIKEDSAASPTQSWQTGHGPATLKQISSSNVRNHLARHCKPDCNSELRLIPPNRSEVICHFRSQVKRDSSSIWNVKHLKAAQHNHQRINLGSFIVWVSFMCSWMHWNGLTSYRTSTSEQLFATFSVSRRATNSFSSFTWADFYTL